MNRRASMAICMIVLLLMCSFANAAADGLDYSFMKKDGMVGSGGDYYLYGEDFIYSFSEDEGGWLCGLMTSSDPYLLFYVQGNNNGREILIQLQSAFGVTDQAESAAVLEFITKDLVHTLELTSAAQERELESFPIYKANYNIIKELALTDDFSVRAYIGGTTYEIAISEEARSSIREMADNLVSQKVMKYYDSSFTEESNVQQLNALISYAIKNPAETSDAIIPQYDHSVKKKAATTGETNALKKAKLYLDVMPFSYNGLVEQLEYEGYSRSEAAYGADNCGADWYRQAAKKAADYLEIMPFSRSSLIDQLEYDGFTYDQAVYGAAQNGY